MNTIIICIAVVAFFWGGWPLVSRAAGESGIIGICVMSGVSFTTIALVAMFQGVGLPASISVLKLIIAGIMIGIGFIAFHIVATSNIIEISAFIPIISASMLIVTAGGGILFFRESVTPQKVIGVIVLIIGIYLLRPSTG